MIDYDSENDSDSDSIMFKLKMMIKLKMLNYLDIILIVYKILKMIYLISNYKRV